MIINHVLVKGVVQEVAPLIFAVIIKNDYDRCMLFCRYSEFYESPFRDIRGKDFSLQFFMKYYIEKNKLSSFEYHNHWSGFNIPSNIIEKALRKFTIKTEYDILMEKIYNYCKDKRKKNDFYLIGVKKIEGDITNHEIAHGLYYLNKDYKKQMKGLIHKINQKDYGFIKKKLMLLGYADKKTIIDDEIQAYLSNKLEKSFDTDNIRKLQKDFKIILKKYMLE
jgi:hypothetical protein